MIRIRAPGRICCFGEHQDYLGFPVIALAISKYIYLEAKRISRAEFCIDLPDLNQSLNILLNNKEADYLNQRDYLRSGYNHLIRKGVLFNKGYQIKITGDIPINAGVGSSSALVIAWLYFLNTISNQQLNPYDLAVEGYNTEVKEFSEAGGMMDHYCSAFGKLIFLKPILPSPTLLKYDLNIDGLVLGNSLESKETVDDLSKVKNDTIKAFQELREIMDNFDPYNTSLKEIRVFLPNLRKQSQKKIIGNIINRDITIKAKNLIEDNIDILKDRKNTKAILKFYQQFGNLLNLHHKQLKENIQISTKKIDKMINNCRNLGAFGGKINGSGFGGTMFSLIPGKEDKAVKTIEECGGEAFIIKTSNGVELY